MEHCGTLWNTVEHCGTLWNTVEHCGTLWNTVEHCGTLWNTVEHCGTLWNTVEHCGTLWNTVEHCGTLWNTVEHCGTLWNTVEHCGTLWNTVEHCGTLWNTVEHCGTLWKVYRDASYLYGKYTETRPICMVSIPRRANAPYTSPCFSKINSNSLLILICIRQPFKRVFGRQIRTPRASWNAILDEIFTSAIAHARRFSALSNRYTSAFMWNTKNTCVHEIAQNTDWSQH